MFQQGRWTTLTDPLNDIRFAFEVQAAMLEEKRLKYCHELDREVSPENVRLGSSQLWWNLVNATARQRSLAAYRAMGGAEVLPKGDV